MPNTYKNAQAQLTTILGTVYTVPASTVAIVRSIRIGLTNTNVVRIYARDSSAAVDRQIYSKTMPVAAAGVETSDEALDQPIVLEAGDSIKGATDSSSADVFISVMEIT